MRHHRSKFALLRFVFSQHPWLRLVDVFVRSADKRPDIGQRHGEFHFLHHLFHLANRIHRHLFQLGVKSRRIRLISRYFTAKILFNHRHRPVQQVTKVIGEIGIDPLHKAFWRKRTVRAEWHLTQQIVTGRVKPIAVDQYIRVHDVALRFGHFTALHQQPAMTKHLLRQWQPKRHQHDRPINRMESDDLLANEVYICRPKPLIQLRMVRAVTQCCDIVGQSIDPHVHNMFRIAFDLHAPVECCPRHGQIFQSRLDEVVDHLVLS
ncbi:hypothetical protein D3C74_314160 [compost metagenome]